MRKERIYPILVLIVVGSYTIFSYPDFYPFPELTTIFTSGILSFFGYKTIIYKNNLVIEGFNPVRISAECSGVILLLAFILVIQLLPTISFKHKIHSLLLIPLILVGNIIRIIMSILVGLFSTKEIMILFHNSFSQIFLFFWAISIYIIWLKLYKLFPKEIFNRKLYDKIK